ncbi:MAG: hypothetical protein QM708_10875 [Propioniciclava sp.]|uniref:hypothetical protein n=1 Tax=Propioniciclava sp. TaxID=2038686 RepID=UPI0039E5FD0E
MGDVTGLIFGGLAAFWLIYLVPLILNRKENGLLDEVEPGEPFSPSVTIVRRGHPLDSAENGTALVSTPLNRRAALRELNELDRGAARRRRLVLAFLGVTATVVAVFAVIGWAAWWTLAVPVGLMGVFLLIARFSVRTMRRNLDARATIIRGGEGVNEDTVPIVMIDEAPLDDYEHSVELTVPIVTGSLWEPIPITAPTYVSRPLASRTVRTIDLAAPVPAVSAVPITADLPEDAEASAEASGEWGNPDERARAVGE